MNAYTLLHRLGFRGFVRRLYRIELVGDEHIPARGACILASNHDSLADPFILGVATTREIRYMAKAELFRNRLAAATFRSLGAFPVERGSADRAAIGEAAELLRRGEVLGIFPQGTSKQHRERRWHRGAARLALATDTPLLPVRMTGTRGFPFGKRVRIVVAPPLHIRPGKPTVAAARELTDRLEQAIGAA